MLIQISHMTHACTYSDFMLVQIFRRSYRAYSYLEIPVGITDQNDIHLFTHIPHSGYYHITMRIPRPVIINEYDTTQYVPEDTVQYCSAVAQSRSAEALNKSVVALIKSTEVLIKTCLPT